MQRRYEQRNGAEVRIETGTGVVTGVVRKHAGSREATITITPAAEPDTPAPARRPGELASITGDVDTWDPEFGEVIGLTGNRVAFTIVTARKRSAARRCGIDQLRAPDVLTRIEALRELGPDEPDPPALALVPPAPPTDLTEARTDTARQRDAYRRRIVAHAHGPHDAAVHQTAMALLAYRILHDAGADISRGTLRALTVLLEGVAGAALDSVPGAAIALPILVDVITRVALAHPLPAGQGDEAPLREWKADVASDVMRVIDVALAKP